jgi:hypothetical protein
MLAGSVWAQEAETDDENDAAPPPETHERIQIHDRASHFEPYFGSHGYDFGPSSPYYDGMPDRYAIGSYYRSRLYANRYYSTAAPFWSYGYGYIGRNRAGLLTSYGRSIGENGDLFLMMPTILAPVGPLTGVFAGE